MADLLRSTIDMARYIVYSQFIGTNGSPENKGAPGMVQLPGAPGKRLTWSHPP